MSPGLRGSDTAEAQGLEEHAEALLGVLGDRQGAPLRDHSPVYEAVEPTHGKPGLHANDDRHDALLVDLRLRGQVLEALPFGEFGDAELEDEGSRQGEGGGRIPALGYAEVGVRRNEGRDLLEVYGPADVVEIEEHGLDEEGQVRAAPPSAPVAAEPPAPLALAAPLRLPGSRLPPKALRAGRFGTRRVVAGMARRPRAPRGKVLRPIRAIAPRRAPALPRGEALRGRARSAPGSPRREGRRAR